MKRQPKKDSNAKRVNFDNERVSEFDKKYEPRSSNKKNGANRNGTTKKHFKAKKVSSQDDVRVKSKGMNDISWYTKNPELVRSAGSIPFSAIAGESLGNGNVLPGILSIDWIPNYDFRDNANAMKQAFDSMFSFLVHANSRNYTYDPIDLGVLTLSGIEVFSILASAVRAYGVAKYYTEESRYTADAILNNLGFNGDDVRHNLGQMWFDLNMLIERTRQIWIPNTLPLLARRIWLNSNIYLDAEGKRAQVYIYNQHRYFAFSSRVGKDFGSSLVAAQIRLGGQPLIFAPGNDNYSAVGTIERYAWSDWYNVINDMIDRLINDQDRGIIYGDILKAYGADKIYAMPTIPSDYRIEPIYNPEVLTQIENTTFASDFNPIGYVQTNAVFLEPWYRYAHTGSETIKPKAVIPKAPLLNFHQKEQPTPEQIMVATRMMIAGNKLLTVKVPTDEAEFLRGGDTGSAVAYTNKIALAPQAAGSEIAMTVSLTWKYTDDAGFRVAPEQIPYEHGFRFSTFDWHPILYGLNQGNNYTTMGEKIGELSDTDLTTNNFSSRVLGEIDNYCKMEVSMLKKLHDVAIFGLLGIPQG